MDGCEVTLSHLALDRACTKHHDHKGSTNLLTSCPCCIPCFSLVTLARQAFIFPFWLRRASEASHVLNQDVLVDEAVIWVFLISPLSIPSGKEQPIERSTMSSPAHPSSHSESNNVGMRRPTVLASFKVRGKKFVRMEASALDQFLPSNSQPRSSMRRVGLLYTSVG